MKTDNTNNVPQTVLPSFENKYHQEVADIVNLQSDTMTVSLSTDQRPSKKHPLSFTINTLHNDDDPWPIEWMMFNVINAYLQPDSKISVDEAAWCLAAVLPENRPLSPMKTKNPLKWMLELSDLIWKIAT